MVLLLPVASLSEEGISLIIQMRLIFLLQPAPRRLSLRRRQLGIFINDMLELIHHTAIWNEHAGVLKMHFPIGVSSVPEEPFHPFFREKFHGHGMAFRRLHGDVRMLPNGILSGKIALEGMAAFMGDYIHVPAGSVEVGEDERRVIQRKIGHISAHSLVLAAKHIKQTVLHHEVKKFLCLRGQLLIHPLSGRQDLLRRSRRIGISLLKINALVNIRKLLQSQTFLSSFMQLFHKRHEILLHLAAEGLYLRLIIAVSVHAVIAQLHIIFVPQLLRLFRAVFHQLIINVVQFLFIFLEKGGKLLPSPPSDFPVGISEIGPQQGQVQRLAVPVDLRRSEKLFIGSCQRIFLLHQRNQLLLHGFSGQLHIFKGHRSDLFLQYFAVRGIIQKLLVLDHHVAVARAHFIIIILLRAVKFIRGISVMPGLRQRHHGIHPVPQRIIPFMNRELLFSALCRGKILFQTVEFLLHPVKIHPFIGHILIFHACLFSCRLPGGNLFLL